MQTIRLILKDHNIKLPPNERLLDFLYINFSVNPRFYIRLARHINEITGSDNFSLNNFRKVIEDYLKRERKREERKRDLLYSLDEILKLGATDIRVYGYEYYSGKYWKELSDAFKLLERALSQFYDRPSLDILKSSY